MKKEQFISELKRKLNRLPKDEIENVISYYNEYFEECGKDDEEVIGELGSPSLIASQILADYAFDDKKENKTWGYRILLIILAIFAAPIGLPIAIAAVCVLFAIVVSIGAVIFALGIATISIFIAGIFSCVGGLAVIFQGPATSMFYIGTGMIIVGISILFALGIKNLLPKAYLYVQDIASVLLSKFNKGKNKGE